MKNSSTNGLGLSESKIPNEAAYSFSNGETLSIQVNFCKNPSCDNFGIPPSLEKGAHRPKVAPHTPGTEYRLDSAGDGRTQLICLLCKEVLPVKSNLGVAEEVARISAYLVSPDSPSCPNSDCANHGVPIGAGTAHYYSNGKSDQGSLRYKCRSCKKTFSVSTRPTLRQRVPHKNSAILMSLMNKVPMSRICELQGIGGGTLYQRID